ncbi:MAG: septation protein A [Cycloclasticus sp. symbiont of Poecilosclerida sp. N]|nr:MAG: septation protein A [Cycloclasticus sp. symbiont of Poecilosclerida sp. N]
MKLLFDFFPILLFYIAFKWQGIYVAISIAIIASTIQVAYSWLRYKRVEKTLLITFVIIAISGGVTLYLQNEMFFKWKPTVINWLFAVICIGSHFIGKDPIIKKLMGGNLSLPDAIWSRLNAIWVCFFITVGAVNLAVAYNFDTDTWADFKLFGMLGLTLVFIVAQGFYLMKYIKEPEKPQAK